MLLCERLLAGTRTRRLTWIAPADATHPIFLSYWSDEATPFDDHVVARYERVRVVGADGASANADLSRYQYRTLRAAAWLEERSARLLLDPRVEHVDALVERVTGHLTHAEVATTKGVALADWAFVSGDLGAKPDYHQRFVGWELELQQDLPLPSAATLMDFRTEQGGQFRFCYTLPLGPRRLFVEHVSHGVCAHEPALRAYIETALGLREFQIVARESGQTPLYHRKPAREFGRAIGIGVGAGLAKFCTGYAIMRMWRDAERLAAGLERNGAPNVVTERPSLSTVADHFFADALASRPQMLPEILPALFRHAPGDAVLAFLDDRATLRQQATVARAMPQWLRWLLRN